MRNVILISTYDMGRQPFALASAAAWLRTQTGTRVDCLDLDIEPMQKRLLDAADLIAFYLPMHTAARLALPLLAEVKSINPTARVCCFGLYAQLNGETLRGLGVDYVLGNNFEPELVEVVRAIGRPPAEGTPQAGSAPTPGRPQSRQQFRVPDRSGLPSPHRYARLVDVPGGSKVVGYTEATRGCKHSCRHCPIVPVYRGRFQAVQREVVLADIAGQVAMGAEHITFGDPDFFNGPTHGMAVVEALHAAHPALTYDVTIKVEHLLKQRRSLERLKATGCLFITTAAESLDDEVLALLDKGHTRRDFEQALWLCREAGLMLCPTFVPFTPWTTRENYLQLLEGVAELGLVEMIPPIQLAIRLLITASSPLLELESVQSVAEPFDGEMLVYPWKSPDPEMDTLADTAMGIVHEGVTTEQTRREIFQRLCAAAQGPSPADPVPAFGLPPAPPAFVPHLTENWFC